MHKTHFLISWPAAGEKKSRYSEHTPFSKVILARSRREKCGLGGAHHLKLLFEQK